MWQYRRKEPPNGFKFSLKITIYFTFCEFKLESNAKLVSRRLDQSFQINSIRNSKEHAQFVICNLLRSFWFYLGFFGGVLLFGFFSFFAFCSFFLVGFFFLRFCFCGIFLGFFFFTYFSYIWQKKMLTL